MKGFSTFCTVLLVALAFWLIYQKNLGEHNAIITYISAWPNGDKLGHFLLFGSVSFFAIFATGFRRFNSHQRLPIYISSCVLACVVVLEECSQKLFESRTFEFADMFANVLGIVAFTALAVTLNKKLNLNLDRSHADNEGSK